MENIVISGRTLFFWGLIYATLINAFNYYHHFHNNWPASLKHSSVFFTIILEAPNGHVHFDEQAMPFEHKPKPKHKHEYKITANSAKTLIRQISTDRDKYTTPLYINIYYKNQASFVRYNKLLYIAKHYNSSLIARGPPLLA